MVDQKYKRAPTPPAGARASSEWPSECDNQWLASRSIGCAQRGRLNRYAFTMHPWNQHTTCGSERSAGKYVSIKVHPRSHSPLSGHASPERSQSIHSPAPGRVWMPEAKGHRIGHRRRCGNRGMPRGKAQLVFEHSESAGHGIGLLCGTRAAHAVFEQAR